MTDPIVALVPLDGSDDALCALRIARRLAAAENVLVRILHVAEKAGPLRDAAASIGLQPDDLRGATFEVRSGSPAEAILAAAADCAARLIVMCAHTANATAGGAISPAAEAVLRGARCPVVLVDPVRAPGDWTLRRLLAPHDGSPTVSDALKPAAALADVAGAQLVVLHVVSDDARGGLERGSIAPPAYLDQVQHSWPAWRDEFLQRLASLCPLEHVPVRLRVAHGDPAEEMVRVAKEELADLIVLAWRGQWAAPYAEMLKAVLRAAPCPVMVTRTLAP